MQRGNPVELVKAAWPLAQFFEEQFGVTFKGSGSSLMGLCPFHNDENPSLSVNPQQGVWKCFGGCEPPTGGDLFTAISKHLGCDFAEALKWAAERQGIQLEPEVKGKARPPLSTAVGEYHSRLRSSLDAMAWLTDPQGRRGLSLETIARFKLGWDGEFYAIPLNGAGGSLVNIKMIHPDKSHKPRMTFFAKGKKVPWFPAETFVQHSDLIAVGGEWDAMRMQQEGFPNAVCWTTGEGGLTMDAAREAKGKRIVLLLDADEPGRTASRRAATTLGQAGATVTAVNWTVGEWGKDATDFLKANGAAVMQELLLTSQPVSGGTASMGGFTYYEAEDGYYRQHGDKEAIRLTDFVVRYTSIWKPHGAPDPPGIEGYVLKGDQRYPFYWTTDELADPRKFRATLMKLSPQLSFSIDHIGQLSALLSQMNPACPLYESVAGPGYAGETYVTPSVIVRAGEVLSNEGTIHVLNDSVVVRAYDLCMPPSNKAAAVEALLHLLSVHDFMVTVPTLSHMVLAPALRFMSASPYTLYLTGPTGVGKTMLIKCMMNLYMDLDPMGAEHGKLMSAHSTANSLERVGWYIQDAPVVIDDLKSGVSDMQGIGRLIQHHYDAHGRGRLKATLELHQEYFIRGLLIITGEQLPHLKAACASVIRRGLVVEVPIEGLRLDIASQVHKTSSLLRGLTAGYIAWLQRHHPVMPDCPTPPSTAERFAHQSQVALDWFLRFCEEWGMGLETAHGLRKTAAKAFGSAVEDSEQEQSSLQEHEVFMSALAEGLASGRLTYGDPTPGQRRVGCLWGNHTCLFPAEVVRWIRDTTQLELTAAAVGRTLKAHGLVRPDPKLSTPRTIISFQGRAVSVWVLADTVSLVQSLPIEDDPFEKM